MIARITRALGSSGALLGPGDDAAVVAAPDGRVVATTDLLVEGRHFRLDWSTAVDVGRKAAAQNLADVAAMGAMPTALLVGLAAPAGLPAEVVDGLAAGLRDEAATVGAEVVGGDTVGSPVLLLAVTALGDLAGRAPVRRSGARPGDVVVLAGTVGRAAAGLAALRGGLAGRFPRLADAHRRPRPPYAAGPALADAGATAMCDVSDGLVQDAGHLADASGVAVCLDADVVAGLLSAAEPDVAGLAVLTGGDPSDPHDVVRGWALGGGEDHALLAAVPAARVDAAVAVGAVVVGEVAAGRGVLDAARRPLAVPGWDHFRSG